MSVPQNNQPPARSLNAEPIDSVEVKPSRIWPITWALIGVGVVIVLGFVAMLCGALGRAPTLAVAIPPVVATGEQEPKWFSGDTATLPASSAKTHGARAADATEKRGRIVWDDESPAKQPLQQKEWWRGLGVLDDTTPSNKKLDASANQKKDTTTAAKPWENDPIVGERTTPDIKAELDRRFNSLNQRISALEAENRSLKTQLQQAQARPPGVQHPKPAPAMAAGRPGRRAAGRVVPARPIAPIIADTGEIYGNIGGGHWIDNKTDDGSIIVLEDGSVWQIADTDRIDTQLWLETTDISVLENDQGYLPYLLVDTDDGEKAEARYMGQK